MTAKEKAKKLVESFIPYADRYLYFKKMASYVPSPDIQLESAKQSALIAVDEVLDVLCQDANPVANYWFEVKQEIEKL